jgi:glycosyltransferase involved in cell wall biosynthesis
LAILQKFLELRNLAKRGVMSLRIAIVHPSAGVNWSGGAEIFAIEIAKHLSKYFDVRLLCGEHCGSFSTPSGGIPRTKSYDMLRYPFVSPFWKWATNIPEVWLEHTSSFLPCAFHLIQNPPDLIFPANEFGGLAMAAFVRKVTGTPVLYTEHGSLLKQGAYLMRNLRFRPNHLVVFSQEVANFVHKVKPSQALSIIPNGVDLGAFHPQGNSINVALPRPIVLCVASLRRHGHKRIELALNAMRHLQSASFLLCGDGPDREYYYSLGIELLGKERFAIISCPYEQMPALYRSADVFTLPSINEPFGLAYLEALASGLPVVATDDPMRNQIIGSAGKLCDVTDSMLYAQELSNVISIHWGDAPRQQAHKFSWESIASQYRDLIENLLAA